jgi:phthiocerol/phenolphthiocerol synthesis type-I polyketide synthase E
LSGGRALLPATAAGLRAAPAELAPSLDHSRPGLKEAYVAPSGEIEAEIARSWQEVFGMELIGIHDNFFDLGGDSLVALQLAARLAEAFSLEITVRHLFEAPTVAGIAVTIEEAMLATADPDEIDQVLAEIETAHE